MSDSFLPSLEEAQTFFDRLRTPMWVYDTDHYRIVWANQAALELWNADSSEELFARDLKIDMSPAIEMRLRQYQRDFEEHDKQFFEPWTLHPKGRPRTVHVAYSGVRLDNGRIGMFCEAYDNSKTTDTHARRMTEALLHTTVMITLYDVKGQALYSNPAARRQMPRAGMTLIERLERDEDRNNLQYTLTEASNQTKRLQTRVHCNGGIRWHDITLNACLDAVTGQRAWLVSEIDITDRKEVESNAWFTANYDALTGLANMKRLELECREMFRHNNRAVLFLIGIDRFSRINDSYGWESGNQLLCKIAERLQRNKHDNEVLARQGDQFALLAADMSFLEAQKRGEEVLNLFRGPLAIISSLKEMMTDFTTKKKLLSGGEIELHPSVSIGICFYPQDASNFGELIGHASSALQRAKKGGRNRQAFFNEQNESDAMRKMRLEIAMRSAINRHGFKLHYQPQINCENGSLYGMEALLRWPNVPHFGHVLPIEFIPLAEESGMIIELGKWVVHTACNDLSWLRQQGIQMPHVAINVSPLQLSDENLFPLIMSSLQKNGLSAADLIIEVTESMLLEGLQEDWQRTGSAMPEDGRALQTLKAICEANIRLSMDDFGTGYSSLSSLRKLAVSEIKLDKSFIDDIADDEQAREVVRAIIQVGHALKRQVLAEGVETIEQVDFLREQNCSLAQGYLFAKPMDIKALAAWLRVRTP